MMPVMLVMLVMLVMPDAGEVRGPHELINASENEGADEGAD